LTLTEFFATGIIENEAIYKELMLGKIKDVKDIEALGQIVVNWAADKNNDSSFSQQSLSSNSLTNTSFSSISSSNQP